MREFVYRVVFPFGGLGLGALGFTQAGITLPNYGVSARFECIGGVDFDAAACRDFEYLTGVPQLCADVTKLTVADVIKHFGASAPHCVFFSPPCKGASGLLSEEKSKTEKYRDMNRLALIWTQLMLKAWAKDLPPLILLENVPRLKSRAADMLKELCKLLKRAGYKIEDGFHDCGELGGLAQHRRRYLLVARLPKKCGQDLYHPPLKRVRGCGEVLSQVPVPGTPEARVWGRMHELPNLSWLNWLRLSLIPAGGDWRDLDGVLEKHQARREVFKRHAVEDWSEPTGTVGGSGSNGVANVADPRAATFVHDKVTEWAKPVGTVTTSPAPSSGAHAVGDPRITQAETWGGGRLGVKAWGEPMGVVAGQSLPGNGCYAVGDPRFTFSENAHLNKYKVRGWGEPASTVIGATRPGSGSPGVADARVGLDDLRVKVAFDKGYAVLRWADAANTVAGGSAVGQGAYSVADIRVDCAPRAGAYGVLEWDAPSRTVTAHLQHDNGAAAVSDPRKAPPFIPVIISDDGTWHRPLTTLELALLQGFPLRVRGEPLKLDGNAHSHWRERIGNAVPAPAARAIADRMLMSLVHHSLGAFHLSNEPIWVLPTDELGVLPC